jgi:hypothetical protein
MEFNNFSVLPFFIEIKMLKLNRIADSRDKLYVASNPTYWQIYVAYVLFNF